MKKNDLQSLRAKEVKELIKAVREKKLELIKFTAKLKSGGEKNVKKAANMKKEIAQILTVLKEKSLTKKQEKTN